MAKNGAIAAMPLYLHPERIERELRELGIAPGDRVAAPQLFAFDQLHYHGTDAVEAAARRLKLGPESHVLEIGSGIGGPTASATCASSGKRAMGPSRASMP